MYALNKCIVNLDSSSVCVRHSTLLVVKTEHEVDKSFTGTFPTELFFLSNLEGLILGKYDGNV